MRAAEFLSHKLIGKNALERERIYRALRLATKHVGEVGIGVLDIALWDIAGKLHNQPIFRLSAGIAPSCLVMPARFRVTRTVKV